MSPGERAQLAAEYALGVLEGADRERADALFQGDPAFTRAVTGWTAHLGTLDGATPRVTPDPALWTRIRAGLANPAAPPPAPQPPAAAAVMAGWRRVWASLGFWRPVGLVAGFAALLLAVGLSVTVQRANRAPVLVAVLLTDASRPAAVVNAFADGRTELIPLDAIDVPPGKALEIWTLWDRARGPVSVGLIDAARRVDLRLEGLPTPGPNQLFEITLEPAAGSPTGRPTGPILMKGTTSTPL